MLSDASCLQASVVQEEVVQVYNGLTDMIRKQVHTVGCKVWLTYLSSILAGTNQVSSRNFSLR